MAKGTELKDIARDCPVSVRMGIFFDGTGNNMNNDLPDRKNGEMTKQYEEFKTRIESGELSLNSDEFIKKDLFCDDNVVRLYELYDGVAYDDPDLVEKLLVSDGTNENMDEFRFKEYEIGTGTHDGRSPVSAEMATGEIEHTKISSMITKIEDKLRIFKDHPGPRKIDLFGFSRGSANARDFLNRVHFQLSSTVVEFAFVGIYDTVASYGMPGDCTQHRNDSVKQSTVTKPYGKSDLAKAAARDIFFKRKTTFSPSKIRENYYDELTNFDSTDRLQEYNLIVSDLKSEIDLLESKASILLTKDDKSKLLENKNKLKWREWALETFKKTHNANESELKEILSTRRESFMDYNYNMHLRKESATRIVHLTAMHEHRDNFNLVSVLEAPDLHIFTKNDPASVPSGANFVEIPLIGVHADLGGGYGPKHRLEEYEIEDRNLNFDFSQHVKARTYFFASAELNKQKYLIEYNNIASQELKVFLKTNKDNSNYKDNKLYNDYQARLQKLRTIAIEKQKQQMISVLEKEANDKNLELFHDKFEDNKNSNGEVIYSTFRYRHIRKLNCGLSIVYLHLMHDFALKAKVPMLNIDIFVKDDPIRFKIPGGDLLNDYLGYLKSGKPADKYDTKKTQEIINQWVHVSSKTDRDSDIPGTNPPIQGGRWQADWQTNPEDPKNLEKNTGRTPTGLAYRQDAFDSDSEDKYSLRELCPNVTEKAILPLEENIEGW